MKKALSKYSIKLHVYKIDYQISGPLKIKDGNGIWITMFIYYVHFISHIFPLTSCTYMYVEHNLLFIWAAISRSVTPSYFIDLKTKMVSNLDTDLIKEGSFSPWQLISALEIVFFSDKTTQRSHMFLSYIHLVNWDSN